MIKRTFNLQRENELKRVKVPANILSTEKKEYFRHYHFFIFLCLYFLIISFEGRILEKAEKAGEK